MYEKTFNQKLVLKVRYRLVFQKGGGDSLSDLEYADSDQGDTDSLSDSEEKETSEDADEQDLTQEGDIDNNTSTDSSSQDIEGETDSDDEDDNQQAKTGTNNTVLEQNGFFIREEGENDSTPSSFSGEKSEVLEQSFTGENGELTGEIEKSEIDIAWETLNEIPITGTNKSNRVIVNVEAQEGTFPKGTELRITPITKTRELNQIREQIIDVDNTIEDNAEVVAFNISFIYTLLSGDEVELQPLSGNTVKVSFNYEGNRNLIKADTNNEQEVKVFHIDNKDENGEEVEEGEEVIEKVKINEEASEKLGEVVVDAESFSTYAVTVGGNSYDIEWNENVGTYTIEGNGGDSMNNFSYGTLTVGGITIMDRNLGATDVWAYTDTWNTLIESDIPGTYGYYYQRGNNYGFKPGVSPTTASDSVDNPSNPYSSSTWHTNQPWTTVTMWGGDSGTEQERQGPCPTGYHVPNGSEWVALVAALGGTSIDEIGLANIDGKGLAKALKLPPAGYRYDYNLSFHKAGSDGSYWSSSPKYLDGANYAYNLYFSDGLVYPQFYTYRSYGFPVRCFKNSYVEPPQTLTFFTVTVDVSPAVGGSASSGSIEAVSGSSITGTIEAGTGFIKSGNVVLSTVTPNPGYIFSGWTTDCGETLTANCTFTGEFKEILYKVEFTGNSVSTGKVEVTSGTEVALTGNEIASSDSKDGYVFIGWNTDSGANEGLSNITVIGDIILYSIFKPITYTVHYDANEGTGTMTDSGYTYDLSGNLAENTFTKTGYVFSGWKYNDEIYTGNQEIKNLTGINGAIITMVTQWKPITYSVEFTGTDVSGTMSNQDFTYDVTGSLTANSFTKTGYEFSGWIYGNTGYANQSEVLNLTGTSGAVLQFIAQWTPITYSIEFTGTDVSGTMANQDFEYDSGQALNANAFTKTGYIFSGWIYGNTGYANQAEVLNLTGTSGAVLQFIAQWTPITYSIEFTGTDVSGTMANQDFTYDISQDLTGNAFTKTGYIFSGWTDGTTGYTDKQNVSNLTTTDGETLTLTAQWTPITYTVSYDASEGTGSIASSGYTYDLSGNLAENTFTKTGYVFSGWMYNNEIYTGNQEIKNLTGINGATITMVTQWTPIKYSVEFTGTDVSGTMANQEFTYDISQDLTGNAFIKTGYIFSGWTDGTTGYTDKQNVSNLTTTDGETLTLTAQWTPITYTISFSGNAADATGTAPATINAEYDSGDIAPDNSFTLTGYTFTGWNTESNGSGTGYATGAELKNLTTTNGATVTLYAQWEANIHKLSFVVDGNTIQSGDVAYSGAISAPAEPKKDCNSFAGWTSSVEGITTTGTMPDSDVTFTANWNYTCSRSSGGGGGSSRNTEKTTETQTGSKVDSSTKATDNEDNTQDSSVKASEGQNQGKTYSDEFQQAYEFAYKHGITTMPTIEQANMEGPLTRIAMAKMLSYYAINVLGQKPDETRVNKFNDISDELDAQYDNGVTLAYQLGIMGINMPKNNFRPNDYVTRAEFGTALSRMLFGTEDGKDNYYSTHLAKLMEEKIITNDNPNLQELRGYVMIMLMRSAQ